MVAALAGAGIVPGLGVVGSEEAFFSHGTGVDWDVIFLLLGMMIIVGVLRRTGVFEYTAIWAAKRAKGSPLRVMVLLTLITAVASAMLDNVTTVLLIAPVTLLLGRPLGQPFTGAGMAHLFDHQVWWAADRVTHPVLAVDGPKLDDPRLTSCPSATCPPSSTAATPWSPPRASPC